MEENEIELILLPIMKTFNKEDYYIYRCETENEEVIKNDYGNISIKGKMQKLQIGREYKAKLELEKIDPMYGATYLVKYIYEDIPDTGENQRHYLESMMTENQVKEIMMLYKTEDNIIELFVEDKIDYGNIKGFGKKTYERVRNKIMENIEHRDMFVHLGRYGVTYEIIKRLLKTFGSSQIAIQKINESPYNLTKVSGIGFRKADAIARNMNISEDDPYRISACIRHVIGQNEQNGHTYIEHDELVILVNEYLEINDYKIYRQLETEKNDPESSIKFFNQRVSSKIAYYAEQNIAKKIKEYNERSKPLEINIKEFIEKINKESIDLFPHGLSDEQENFIYNLCKYNLNILVGSAGTGKSSLQHCVKVLLKQLGLTVKYLCPTGKAAKVLTEYTGVQAMTIHKAIGFGLDKEDKDMNEITEDFIVIDEFSMVDVTLLSSLLNQIKNPQTRILFIGDTAQIASVSMGNILHDMVNSKIVPVSQLTKVFRQSEGGLLDIITRIRLGQKFVNNDFQGKMNFGNNFILHCVDSQHLESGYKHYYNYFLTQYKPEEILVLSPTKKGKVGTVNVNKELQKINNPYKGQKEIESLDDSILRVGDYVINIKNTYEATTINDSLTEIVNGDTGYIVDIIDDWKKDESVDDKIDQLNKNGIWVNFGSETVVISFDNKTQLLHGWCISKHRSQGSSAKAVICIADKAHKFQLNRNLLYTGTSRCKEKEVLISQADTVNFALRKVENLKRKTMLLEFLIG